MIQVVDILLPHFGPFSTNWTWLKSLRLSMLTISIPLWPQCVRLLMAACHKTQIISNRFLEHGLHNHQISHRAHLGCGGMGNLHHGCTANKSTVTVWYYQVNSGKAACSDVNYLKLLKKNQIFCLLLNLCQRWSNLVQQSIPDKVSHGHIY